MHVSNEQLKAFLLDSGLVSRKEIESALKEAQKKGDQLGKTLLKNNKISEDNLRRTEAYILGIPFVNLKGQKIDFDILSLIPEPIARNHNVIAFRKRTDALEIAMLDTEDLEAIDFVRKKVGLKILPRLTDVESIKEALVQYRKSLKAEFGDIITKESISLKALPDEGADRENATELRKLAEDLPVVRIVDTLLNHAILQNASDIHIQPMEKEVLIRYRIDGILHDAMVLPKNAAPGITARIKVLGGLKLDEKRLPQDGRFKIEREGERVSFRVSTLPTYYGEKTVLRLLRENISGFVLESLGFHGEGLEKIYEATKQKAGIILVTGPTGSGKTTTLYTVLEILNTPEVNISTVEDPIEYQLPRINQTQVKPDIGLTFANGLRSLIRQDPDILMVGEIVRIIDEETIISPGTETDAKELSGPQEKEEKDGGGIDEEEEKKVRFNPEHHILLEDAQKIKKDVQLNEEMIFPLEEKGDYGRIAAQTAKQVIIQRIREAERVSVMDEYEKRRGEIVSGSIQRIEHGNIYVDLGRVTGIMPYDEQIPGEHFRPGEQIRAYLYAVEETARDIMLMLSRSHPKFLHKLLEMEIPEVASEVVEIKSIAREPGSRSKIAVFSHDEHIDPVGSCVGQRGVRVATIMSELGGEKIDIIEWSSEPEQFIERALSPAQVLSVSLDEKNRKATIQVGPDQYSLAIGKGGQNARLAAKLSAWKIDIRESAGRQDFQTDKEEQQKQEKETAGKTREKAETKEEGKGRAKEKTKVDKKGKKVKKKEKNGK